METDAQIRAAELDLLSPATRRDSARVSALLAADYVEIGRSGRRWTRDDVVAHLAHEPTRPTPVTDEWAYVPLAPGLTLVTYRIRGADRDSRHSSIWDLGSGSPVMRFHQGTVVPPA